MININSYIIEKLHLNKDTLKEKDIDETVIDLLKEYGAELDLHDALGYEFKDENGDVIDYIWYSRDSIKYSYEDNAAESNVLNDLYELFTKDELTKIYDFLKDKI